MTTTTTTTTIPTHIERRINAMTRTNSLPTTCTRAAALHIAGSPEGGWTSQARLDEVTAAIMDRINS